MADIPVHVRFARQYAAAPESLRDTSPVSDGEIMWLAVLKATHRQGF